MEQIEKAELIGLINKRDICTKRIDELRKLCTHDEGHILRAWSRRIGATSMENICNICKMPVGIQRGEIDG